MGSIADTTHNMSDFLLCEASNFAQVNAQSICGAVLASGVKRRERLQGLSMCVHSVLNLGRVLTSRFLCWKMAMMSQTDHGADMQNMWEATPPPSKNKNENKHWISVAPMELIVRRMTTQL